MVLRYILHETLSSMEKGEREKGKVGDPRDELCSGKAVIESSLVRSHTLRSASMGLETGLVWIVWVKMDRMESMVLFV